MRREIKLIGFDFWDLKWTLVFISRCWLTGSTIRFLRSNFFTSYNNNWSAIDIENSSIKALNDNINNGHSIWYDYDHPALPQECGNQSSKIIIYKSNVPHFRVLFVDGCRYRYEHTVCNPFVCFPLTIYFMFSWVEPIFTIDFHPYDSCSWASCDRI